MTNTITMVQGKHVLVCSQEGDKLKSEREAAELIGEALQEGAEMVLIPRERLTDDFFHLKTGLAGQIVQKFVTYRRHLVILGNISKYVAQSNAFKAFVYESNHGTSVWFLKDLQELDERLLRLEAAGSQQGK